MAAPDDSDAGTGDEVEGSDASPDDADPADADADPEADADADQWRFALDEVGPEAEAEDTRPPIEPESPSLENVVFVLLGVVLTVVLLFSVINP